MWCGYFFPCLDYLGFALSGPSQSPFYPDNRGSTIPRTLLMNIKDVRLKTKKYFLKKNVYSQKIRSKKITIIKNIREILETQFFYLVH